VWRHVWMSPYLGSPKSFIPGLRASTEITDDLKNHNTATSQPHAHTRRILLLNERIAESALTRGKREGVGMYVTRCPQSR
jgi:hypothetical protein